MSGGYQPYPLPPKVTLGGNPVPLSYGQSDQFLAALRRTADARDEMLAALGREEKLPPHIMPDAEIEAKPYPTPILLNCPCCGERHIDEGEWGERPHHTHACQSCGTVWRPALVDTVGVRFLPGFKNEGVGS